MGKRPYFRTVYRFINLNSVRGMELKINGVWYQLWAQIPDRAALHVDAFRIDDMEFDVAEWALIKNDRPKKGETAIVYVSQAEQKKLMDRFCGGAVELRFCDIDQFRFAAVRLAIEEVGLFVPEHEIKNLLNTYK